MNVLELTTLEPKLVELTKTKGILRCMREDESRVKAHGLIFLCPVCKDDKEKKHFQIFLFERPGVHEAISPQGRFLPSYEASPDGPSPTAFSHLTLTASDGLKGSYMIRPQDTCGWKGMLIDGKVSWD